MEFVSIGNRDLIVQITEEFWFIIWSFYCTKRKMFLFSTCFSYFLAISRPLLQDGGNYVVEVVVW